MVQFLPVLGATGVRPTADSSKPGIAGAKVKLTLSKTQRKEPANERVIKRTVSPLTPALSPLRGEGESPPVESRWSNLWPAALESGGDAMACAGGTVRSPSPLTSPHGERAGVRGDNCPA